MIKVLKIIGGVLAVAGLAIAVLLLGRSVGEKPVAGRPPADPMSDPGVVAALGRARKRLDDLFARH